MNKKRRALLLVAVLLLATVILAGCGVPQGNIDLNNPPGWWEGNSMGHYIVNNKAFEALPKPYQAALHAACGESAADTMAKYDALNPQALKKLVAAGAQPVSWCRAIGWVH